MNVRETNGVPRFRDQVALVVGAAHGIGKAIAMRLGREGANVVIADVDAAAMETTVQEMRSEGSECKGVIVRRPRSSPGGSCREARSGLAWTH